MKPNIGLLDRLVRLGPAAAMGACPGYLPFGISTGRRAAR